MTGTTRALDYATRKLIADQVAAELKNISTTIRDEFRANGMHVERVPVPQLHGPESVLCETFVLGAVLSGYLTTEDAPLVRSDFWARIHGRVWEAMQAMGYSRVPYATEREACAAVLEHAHESGTLEGEPTFYLELVTTWAELAPRYAALHDVAGAVVVILEAARARRLVGLLARLADGLCARDETHESAYGALRDHFQAERVPLLTQARQRGEALKP